MMTDKQALTLDDVLNEFVAACDRPTAKALETWVKRYPEFGNELVDFAAVWAEQLTLPAAPELSAEEEKALVDRAMSHVVNVAFSRDRQERSQGTEGAPIASLTGEARKAGISPAAFAKACDLDLALMSKLENRQIRPGSIPSRLITALAALLRRPVEAITAFLAVPPQISAGKAFLSRGKPRSKGQQNFADAVRASSLSETEKARWLEETAEPEKGT